jgi:CheY-like chemotaxis protein
MKKILIAEDDKILMKRLVRSFEKKSPEVEVLSAENGKEAIAVLQQGPVDLLITDIQMPEIDGLTLLAYVNEKHPRIPCFVMTAYETPELRQKLGKDILRFFSKPFDLDKFQQEAVSALSQKPPSGYISGISVVSFLHMIQIEKKTCLFEVILPDDKKGIFYFEKGEMFDAICGQLKGEDAALEIITNERAKFSFKKFPDKKIAKRIKKGLVELIAEAIKREDEKNISEVIDDIDFDDLDI